MIGIQITDIPNTNTPTTCAIVRARNIIKEHLNPTHICVQIFVTGPQDTREIMSAEDKRCTRALTQSDDTRPGVTLIIHGSYVDVPWRMSSNAIANIKQEIRIAAEIGARGVIIHLGDGAQDAHILKRVLTTIAHAYNPDLAHIILYLEIHAASPSSSTFEKPSRIQKLFSRILAMRLPMIVGLCIDTAHLHSCGKSLDSAYAARSWLRAAVQLHSTVPVMFHLNDSTCVRGSGIDKHAPLCMGEIWKDYHPNTGTIDFAQSGLAYILAYARENDCICILERATRDIELDLTLLAAAQY